MGKLVLNNHIITKTTFLFGAAVFISGDCRINVIDIISLMTSPINSIELGVAASCKTPYIYIHIYVCVHVCVCMCESVICVVSVV